jgi:hypothetical protein
MKPDTFADGIEAAAQVADRYAAGSVSVNGFHLPNGEFVAAALAAAIRAIATDPTASSPDALAKVDRVFASAPGGESGWLPIESAPQDERELLLWQEPWETPVIGGWIDSSCLDGKSGWMRQGGYWCEPTHWQPLPAPPGAPPVSAPPAESAGEVDEWKSRALIAEGEVERLNARVAGLTSRVDEWHGHYVAAEAKCRELEGAYSKLADANAEIWKRADSVVAAAQAARGALGALAPSTHEGRRLRDEALASLVAVLPGSGGADV